MAAVIMATAVTVQAQRRTPPGPDDTPVFRADVVIDEQVVDEQGAVLETRPQTRYRMTVRRSGRRLRTEIVYPPARLLTTGPLVDPRGGYRLVFDGDMANGRIYDATGAVKGTVTTEQDPLSRPYGMVETLDGKLWIVEGGIGRVRQFPIP